MATMMDEKNTPTEPLHGRDLSSRRLWDGFWGQHQEVHVKEED